MPFPIAILAQMRSATRAGEVWRLIALVVAAVTVLLLVISYLRVALRRRPAARGQHITKQGGIFFVATLAIGVVALNTKINFLVLIFGMMLSAALLSVVLSRLTMRRVSFERTVPRGAHPGQPFPIEVRVRNDKRWLASYGLAVRDVLPEGIHAERPNGVVVQLGPGTSASVCYTASATQRGVYAMEAVSFSTRFPFGLFHQARTRPLASEIVVYPRLGRVAAGFIARAQTQAETRPPSQQASGHEEFRGLREYRPGDNPRWIHWKSSAKLGQPLVKEYEAAIADRAFILLDTRSLANGDEPLESAIRFAATLGRDLIQRNFQVSLAAYAPELAVTGGLRGVPGLQRLLEMLGRLRPNPGRRLVELAGEPRVRTEEHALVVAVLLRADDDAAAALDRLQARARRILAVDASAPSFPEFFSLA